MKITNENIGSLSYWLEIIDPFFEKESELTALDLKSNFQGVIASNGDEEEVGDIELFACMCLQTIIYGRVYRKRFLKTDRELKESRVTLKSLEEEIDEIRASNLSKRKEIEASDANTELDRQNKTIKNLREQLDAAISEAQKASILKEQIEEWRKKYAAQTEITANRDLQIEELKKKGHDSHGGNNAGPESSTAHDHESVHSPQLHLVNDLQQFYIPFEEYPSLTQSVGTTDIANDEQLKRVQKTLKIANTREFSRTAFEFTISCGSRSTSNKDPYEGIIKIGGKSWNRRDIVYAIKSAGLTVRQFCAAYANLYWNFNLARDTPPENWRKKGFTEFTKFAAFDFFYAVGSNAAIPTEKDGHIKLIRPPTNEENEANTSMKYADLLESSYKSAGHVTASPLYNKGSSYESKNQAKLIEF